MKFTGLCTYPHGGYTSAGLVLATAAALIATAVASSSCRFMVLSFTSDSSFEESFNTFTQDGAPQVRFKAGVGLFQWLRPTNLQVWSTGTCAGYQESMLEGGLSDPTFETARGFAVFSMLLATVVTLWSLVLACVEINWIQVILFDVCCFLGFCCAGLTFLVKGAAICQDVFDESSCRVDEGGLMMIAAMIMWVVAFIVGVVFLRPNESKAYDFEAQQRSNPRLSEAERARRIAKRRAAAAAAASTASVGSRSTPSRTSSRGTSQKAAEPKATTPATLTTYSFDSEKSWTTPVASRSPSVQQTNSRMTTPRQSQNVVLVDDVTQSDQMEVYLSQRLNQIEKVMDTPDMVEL